MGFVQRHLDAYLQAIRPPALVALAQVWGVPPSTSPHAALATILAVLNAPPRVQQLVDSLSAQEQTALALVQFISISERKPPALAVRRKRGAAQGVSPHWICAPPFLASYC